MLEWFISFLFLFTGQSNNLRVFIGLREILFIWYRCLLLGLIFMTHVILIDTHVLIYWYYTYSNTVANADIEKSTALNISSADILQRVALWAPPIGYSLQGVNSRAKLLLLGAAIQLFYLLLAVSKSLKVASLCVDAVVHYLQHLSRPLLYQLY